MTKHSEESEYTPQQRRRALRTRSTKPEQLMWAALRNRRLGGLKFRRQYSIGVYIVDFVCVEKKLVIEIDGAYHEDVEDEDARRQRYLESEGFQVLRFTNEDVLNDAQAVVVAIAKVAGVPPHPIPLPHRAADNANDKFE
ncbi:MAG: endonuclease domain-containing protein [Pirellulales bacterium]